MKLCQSSNAPGSVDFAPNFKRSTIYLVFLGFLISYVFFFIKPVFLNAEGHMLSKSIVPVLPTIGNDLEVTLQVADAWWRNGTSPYAVIPFYWYPPFVTLIFTPLTFVNFSMAYYILTIFTIIAYFFSTFLIPLWMTKDNTSINLPFIILFSLTGAVSYGFQFELERGQFNVIAFSACILGIYLYHQNKKYLYVSCFLITVATQLKFYPAIFILMLVRDWNDWPSLLKLFISFFLFNTLMLFILGSTTFSDFLKQLPMSASFDGFVWVGNHSIKSFAALFPRFGARFIPVGQAWLFTIKWFFQVFFLALFAIGFMTIWWRSPKNRENGINSPLFLACAVGACLIPPVSEDYKLPIITAPILLYLTSIEFSKTVSTSWIKSLASFLVAFIYSATLFPYAFKPYWLWSNTPMLLLLIMIASILTLFETSVDESRL